jgi:hypothetical protein
MTHRSLRRLKGYLERRRAVRSIAVETLRTILRERNVTFQRTRSWKRNTDPLKGARATLVRRGGLGYFFGAYDVHAEFARIQVTDCRTVH